MLQLQYQTVNQFTKLQCAKGPDKAQKNEKEVC